jgi:serine/threonine protein phosphatase PrpC
MVALYRDPTSTAIKGIAANVGDCRAVLSDKGKAVQLTFDHKPNAPKEKERIEAAGGFVHNGRVNGLLAVSRSIGDVNYKVSVIN